MSIFYFLLIRFCFEGMEESGSEGLDAMLFARQNTKFMKEVDFCCISGPYTEDVAPYFNYNGPLNC